jgi:hypothetical protein
LLPSRDRGLSPGSFCNLSSESGVERVPECKMDRFAEIRAKREAARRARRLAWSVIDDVIRERMLAFAQELEAEADAQAWDSRSLELKSGMVQ